MNLDAYLSRIGYTGSRAPTLETLSGIHRRHPEAIPFENLDVLLGRPIRLELGSIEQKLVRERRGGYCFEQNTLLFAALRALGFRVTPMIARVRWQVPADVTTPQTHMVLRVEIDGREWLADGGFGGVGLVEPLALDIEGEQVGGAEPRRLVRDGRHLMQQVKLNDTWTDVYRFANEEAPMIDFEVGNWYTSTHPNSRFRQNLVAARVAGGRRLAVFNREFTVRFLDGRAERREIANADELLQILAEEFGLRFPSGTRFGPPDAAWPT